MNKKPFKNERIRELFLYCVVGGLTTLVNIVVYALFTRLVAASTGVPADSTPWLAALGTCVAWVFAVAFAFYPNKKYVFRSEDGNLKQEIAGFVTARHLSLGIDPLLMLLFVGPLRMNDMVAKIITQVIVIAANYFASKFWIFRKRKGSGKQP